MSTLELRRIIQQLNRLDVDGVDYRHIVLLIQAASKGTTAPIFRKTEMYFRARVHNGPNLANLSEFGAPPDALVKGYQRCNPPGKSMFYSASKRINALLECNVTAGDTVYLGQWICKEPPPINTALFPVDSQTFSRHDEMSKVDEVFYTYLDTIFTRPIHESFSDQYKVTAAATEVLTTNFITHQHDVRADGTVGLLYSSVANSLSGHNTAFHASFAAERLELIHLMKLKILARNDKHLKIDILDNASEFKGKSALWLGDSRAIPKLRTKSNGFNFISNGRSWLVPVRAEVSSEEEIDALLEE